VCLEYRTFDPKRSSESSIERHFDVVQVFVISYKQSVALKVLSPRGRSYVTMVIG
jgi:hypothetical protein